MSRIKDWELFTIYSLRHTFACHLVMERTDLYIVSKFLGHSSVTVTHIYSPLTQDYLKNSVERPKF